LGTGLCKGNFLLEHACESSVYILELAGRKFEGYKIGGSGVIEEVSINNAGRTRLMKTEMRILSGHNPYLQCTHSAKSAPLWGGNS
jgi:hypothetical protein